MTDIEEAATGWHVTQFLYRATALADAGRWDELAELYAPDATFARPSAPDRPIVGRAAILESFRARPARASRHIVSNVVVDVISADEAHVASTLTLFAGPPADGIAEAETVVMVGGSQDHVRREDGQWRFVARRGSMALRYGAPG